MAFAVGRWSTSATTSNPEPIIAAPANNRQAFESQPIPNSGVPNTLLDRLSPYEKQIWNIWSSEWLVQHNELEKRLGRPTGSTQTIVLAEFLQMRDEEAQMRGQQVDLRPILIRDVISRCDEHRRTMLTVALSKDSLAWHSKWLDRWKSALRRIQIA
jgi:hypothetical protein